MKSSVEKSRSATTPPTGSVITQLAGSGSERSSTVTPSGRMVTLKAPFAAMASLTTPVARLLR